jgi:hypothetical protein
VSLVVGSRELGSAAGIVEFSLWYTLWSFAGLLTLPTYSRAGVIEVDRVMRASGYDETVMREVIEQLDGYQDRERRRPADVEAIFHPIPSVSSRLDEGSAVKGRSLRGGVDTARTAVFLSASGLGLLGRAVHCNCGRPELWVYLPTD